MPFLSKSEDPDEMPHNVPFHQGLPLFAATKKGLLRYKISTCDP